MGCEKSAELERRGGAPWQLLWGLTQMLTVAALGTGSPVKAMAASCMGAEFYPETYFASGIPTQTLNFQRVIGNSMGGDTAAAGVAIVGISTPEGRRLIPTALRFDSDLGFSNQ